jgi:hypothetical protein
LRHRESPSSATFGSGGFGFTGGSDTVRFRSIGSGLAVGFWESCFDIAACSFGISCQSGVNLMVEVSDCLLMFVERNAIILDLPNYRRRRPVSTISRRLIGRLSVRISIPTVSYIPPNSARRPTPGGYPLGVRVIEQKQGVAESKRWGDDGVELWEFSLLKIDSNGKLLGQYDSTFGISSFPQGIIHWRNKLMIFGGLGGRPAISPMNNESVNSQLRK